MAVTKASNSSIVNKQPKYISLLAGNPYYTPPTFESIATATGTGSSGTITFSSIPSTYKHLQIRINAIADGASATSLRLQFNGITTTVYSYHALLGDGSSVTSTGTASQSEIRFNMPFSTTYPLVAIIDISDYANTSKYKTVKALLGLSQNNTTASDQSVNLGSGLYQQTTAISSISVIHPSQNFTTATTIALYGIKG